MSEGQSPEFIVDEDSVLRVCDFGPEFGADRLRPALPDLDPIVPT